MEGSFKVAHILAYITSLCLFWLYTKLIYHKARPFHRSLVAAHAMFAALNTILWDLKSYNIPYWVIIPIITNSTRIELLYESLMIHANNIPFALLTYLKNTIFISLIFAWASAARINVVISILSMDVIHFLLDGFALKRHWTNKRVVKSSYLSIRTIKEM